MADAGLLRQENTALLRRAMQDGVFSKNELARQTGLSFPTIGRIIDDMVERGEAREAGVAASTGGRCAMRYELDMHYRLFLCLRLEQDTLHWFVCGLDGVPLEQGDETCPGDVRELLDTLLMRVRARYPQLASVAFGFAGAMHDGVVMECFGYPELRGVSLSTHLHDKSGLPSAAARDMQIVAAGYAAQCSPAPRAAVCIYIGRMGAGAGIVLDGKVWSGAAGFAGELHFLPIEHNMEYAQTHFADADMTAYMAQVICACGALINPDRVVLYTDPLFRNRVEDIRAACARMLPPHAVPEIELSRTFTEDYDRGLFTMARDLMEGNA